MQEMDFLAELEWRGLHYQSTPGVAEALRAARTSGYIGFDPTAASLHVGSLVPIMGLVHLQRAGHRPVVLVGGGTGMIGDPSGKTNERALLTGEAVAANVKAIGEQLSRFLDFSGDAAARLVDNADWLLSLGAVEFMRDVGKHFTVNYMLAKDSVRSRMDAGISYTEFSYMLLQGYDFLKLNEQGVTLQLGGSDQWGNMTAGMELVRRTTGNDVHVVTFPLLTTSAGTKFGKTEAGTVWLDPELTSPYEFYQFWMHTDDRDVGRYLRALTLLGRDEIAALESQTASDPQLRAAQTALARDVTARTHGAEAARTAEEVTAVLFGRGDPLSLTNRALQALAREVPSSELVRGESATVAELFARSGLVKSKGEARRLADGGGAYVNGARAAANATVAELGTLGDGWLLLRKGARDYAVVKLTG